MFVENYKAEQDGSNLIDPIKAKVNMMIKQRLDKKSKTKNVYDRRKRDTSLNVLEYYDYDADEEQERNAPVIEQEIKIKDDEISNKDNGMMKRSKRNIQIKRNPR